MYVGVNLCSKETRGINSYFIYLLLEKYRHICDDNGNRKMITVVDKNAIVYDNGSSKHGDNGISTLELGLYCVLCLL